LPWTTQLETDHRWLTADSHAPDHLLDANGRSLVGASGSTSGTGTGGSCQLGPFGSPEVITGLGLDTFGLWGPSLSGDGLTLYFGVNETQGYEHIYRAKRTNRGPVFSAAERVNELASSSSEGTPCISSDELAIYFYSTRGNGSSNRDLWMATRASIADSFGAPIALTVLNTANIDYEPWISADERLLLFSSAGPSAQTGYDIWMTTRSDKSQAFPAAQRVTSLATTSDDQRACLSRDGLTVYFASSRSGGLGLTDIWCATRTDPLGDFGPAALVQGINSSATDLDPMLSRDDTELFFTSARGGLNKLYRVVRTCL